MHSAKSRPNSHVHSDSWHGANRQSRDVVWYGGVCRSAAGHVPHRRPRRPDRHRTPSAGRRSRKSIPSRDQGSGVVHGRAITQHVIPNEPNASRAAVLPSPGPGPATSSGRPLHWPTAARGTTPVGIEVTHMFIHIGPLSAAPPATAAAVLMIDVG